MNSQRTERERKIPFTLLLWLQGRFSWQSLRRIALPYRKQMLGYFLSFILELNPCRLRLSPSHWLIFEKRTDTELIVTCDRRLITFVLHWWIKKYVDAISNIERLISSYSLLFILRLDWSDVLLVCCPCQSQSQLIGKYILASNHYLRTNLFLLITYLTSVDHRLSLPFLPWTVKRHYSQRCPLTSNARMSFVFDGHPIDTTH